MKVDLFIFNKKCFLIYSNVNLFLVSVTVFEGENWKEQSRTDLSSLWKSGWFEVSCNFMLVSSDSDV